MLSLLPSTRVEYAAIGVKVPWTFSVKLRVVDPERNISLLSVSVGSPSQGRRCPARELHGSYALMRSQSEDKA